MEIYEIDLIKLKAEFWDRLRAQDGDMGSDDEDVLATLSVQEETIEIIEALGTIKTE